MSHFQFISSLILNLKFKHDFKSHFQFNYHLNPNFLFNLVFNFQDYLIIKNFIFKYILMLIKL